MGKKKKTDTKLIDISEDEEESIESRELALLHNILNTKTTNPKEYASFKHVLYATAIFTVLSLPFTDRLIELALPLTKSWLFLVGIKTIIFFVTFCTIYYFTRNNSINNSKNGRNDNDDDE